MKRIVDCDPAPYPLTNTPEIKAVVGLIYILDLNCVKPDAKFLDKVPNTDGILELVNQYQTPIGKLEVQIKVLGSKNIETPKYQCSKPFLAFCEQSILPVLLIVVDIQNQIAYWEHISIDIITDLFKKIKKETVSLLFDKKKTIKPNNNSYLAEWIEIIKKYQTKLYDYNTLETRVQTLSNELSVLKISSNISLGKSNSIYKEIHVFLDYYNHLLDHDFLTLKNLLFPNYWKMGFGIKRYEENSVSFIIYPVSYSINDVLIKDMKDDDSFFSPNQGLRYVGYNRENPIKNKPKFIAYQLIKRDLINYLEKQSLLIKDVFVAREYLFAFIEKYALILGLIPDSAVYELENIEYSLNTFLPAWIEKSIDVQNYDPNFQVILIDTFYLFTFPKEIENQSEKVKQDIKDGFTSSIKFQVTSEDFSIGILNNLLAFLRQSGETKIVRDYEIKTKVNKQMYGFWETFGKEKTAKNIEIFYNNFPRIYDQTVKNYFPNLYSELKYFVDFNLLIIVVDFSNISLTRHPGIRFYHYFTETIKDPQIKSYSFEDEEFVNLMGKMGDFYNPFSFEGHECQLKSWSNGILDFIYDKTPIMTSVNNLLREKLEEYFKNREETN